MEFEQALEVVNATFSTHFGRPLNDVETTLFQGSWNNLTYEQIAEATGYSIRYIKGDVGAKFWKQLGQVLGEPVSKTNFRSALERQGRKVVSPQDLNRETNRPKASETVRDLCSDQFPAPITEIDDPDDRLFPLPSPPSPLFPLLDWGETLDVSLFYGRTEELHRLTEWVLPRESDWGMVAPPCRMIALLGMGGIGKTALAAKLAQQVASSFQFVIWRSLRNAPPLEILLRDLVGFLSNHQDSEPELSHLIQWLRHSRCLVILDNAETILKAGEGMYFARTGQYRPGYENYSDLFRVVGETSHASCLILTSREKPAEVATLEGMEFAVRSMRLTGSLEAALALIQVKGLVGTPEKQRELCDRYSSSPLALKIIATLIQDLFAGDIAEFLNQDTTVFEGIRRLLDQQFNRLSVIEQSILYWLAINREWTGMAELMDDMLPPVSRSNLLEALEALSWRSLIEKQSGRYTEQPVVMEYVTDRLVEQVSENLHQDTIPLDSLFHRHALVKTTVKDYIRESQIRLILEPIAIQLIKTFGTSSLIKTKFQQILDQLRSDASTKSLNQKSHGLFYSYQSSVKESLLPVPSYAAGNLINLCTHMQLDLAGCDFSHLSIWYAYLQKVNLHGVNFQYSDLSKSLFTKSLESVLSVAFSPDGQLLATSDTNGVVQVWQVADGQQLLTCRGHENWVWSVAFSPDGQTLASCSEDQTIRLWDVAGGKLPKILKGHTDWIWAAIFSPDGRLIGSCSDDKTVRLWDGLTGQPLWVFQGHTNRVWCVAFSSDGSYLASGGLDCTIKLWDINRGECRATLRGHTESVASVAFSPDGRLLASGSHDKTVRLWDMATGQLLMTLDGHTSWVWAVAFSPDGQILASASEDHTIRCWDGHTGKPLKRLQGHSKPVSSISFSPDGRILASGGHDQTVRLWDMATGQTLKTLWGYTSGVQTLAFPPPNHPLSTYHRHTPLPWLVSGGQDQLVRLWNSQTGRPLKTFHGHTNWVRGVALSADGKIVASGGHDQTVRVWALNDLDPDLEPVREIVARQSLRVLHGHTSWIRAIAITPDGQFVASGSEDQTVRIWDWQQGTCRYVLRGHTGQVLSVMFSLDQEWLVSGSDDQTARLWDLKTGESLRTFEGHTSWIWAIALSPDKRLLASGSEDHTIRLWEVATGEVLHSLKGHTSSIVSVAFSPDQRTLASGAYDQTVCLWDVETGTLLHQLQGHSRWVRSVAFSPDGQILASGSTDETIRLWDVSQLCQRDPGVSEDTSTEIPVPCIRVLRAERPYEGLNITGATGLTDAQKATLCALGAISQAS